MTMTEENLQETVPEPEQAEEEKKGGFTREKFKEELKLFLENFIYLATCLSVLETYRSLVLLQFGINQFAHGYVIAVSAGLVMGKLTTLSRRIKAFEIFDSKPLIWPILYRSAMMTVFVKLFKTVEELVFKSGHEISGDHALVLTITHFAGTMFVFMVLFTVRGLEERLGEGRLKELFFSPPSSEDCNQE